MWHELKNRVTQPLATSRENGGNRRRDLCGDLFRAKRQFGLGNCFPFSQRSCVRSRLHCALVLYSLLCLSVVQELSACHFLDVASAAISFHMYAFLPSICPLSG